MESHLAVGRTWGSGSVLEHGYEACGQDSPVLRGDFLQALPIC